MVKRCRGFLYILTNKKEHRKQLFASGDFFGVFEDVVPELRGHFEGGCNAAFACGLVGFGQNVGKEHRHALILTALDIHFPFAVFQPSKRNIEFSADIRDCTVTGHF